MSHGLNHSSEVHRLRRAGIAAALGLTSALAGPGGVARADDAPAASNPNTVADVIVTATRQETKLQQTPVAVSVIGGDEITARGLITARDLAGQVAGATILRSGITPLTQTFFIRGIGNSDPIFDPNVAQYVDDVYLPRAINGMTDLSDIERVEVLRGPQGTLFGENADAGAIRYITRKPKDHFDASGDVAVGSYNTLAAHAYVTGPVAGPQLLGSLAIARDQHDGYTYDPTIRRHVNNQDTTGARAKLLYLPNARLSLLVTLDGTLDRSDTAYYIPRQPIIGGTLKTPVYGAFDPSRSYASQTPRNNSYSGGISAKLSYELRPGLTLNSVSAYRGFAQDPVNYNNDGQPLVPYSPAVPTPVSISDNYIVYREQEATQELQLQGRFSRLSFSSGLYFLWEDFTSNRIGYVVSPTAASPTPAYPEDQIGDTRTTNIAAYAQGDYRLTDQLTVTLGGRFTSEHRDFAFQGIWDTLSGAPITPVPGAPVSTPGGYAAVNNFTYHGAKTWSSFTPKVGLSFQATPDIFTYASISQGFDAGGFNNRASSLATALPYDQENVTTYEIGVKTDLFQRRVRANLTAFYNAYDNLQQTAAVISPVTNAFVSVRSNAGRAHTEGFEFETSAQPLDGLTLTGSASYLLTRYDSFTNAGVTVVNGVSRTISVTGNQLPFSPRWQVFTGASYTLHNLAGGDVTVGGNVTYVSRYVSDVFNYRQGRVPPQSFIDATVSYRRPESRWTYSLIGRNLGDRRLYQSLTWGGTPNLWQGPVSPPLTVVFKASLAL